MAAITAVLARFPEEVITSVTHPVSGLPSKKSWLPTVKEVSDACDEIMEPIVQHAARLKRIKEQLEMRERQDRGEKPTLAQLTEKYGENWGLTPREIVKAPAAPAPTWKEIASHYAIHDLEFQKKNTE